VQLLIPRLSAFCLLFFLSSSVAKGSKQHSDRWETGSRLFNSRRDSKNRGAGTNEFVIASQRTRAKSRGPMTGSAKQSRAACENREAVLDCFVASLLAMTRTGCPMPRQRNQASRQRKLRDADFTARYKMEKILQRRRYCAVFELWRRCADRRCRRRRACAGDDATCLKRTLPAVPHTAQWQARQEILAATPKNLGAPERAARQCMPLDLYIESAAQAVGEYLVRFERKGPPARR
jgi:hypothetical protein